MKKIIYTLLAATTLFSCSQNAETTTETTETEVQETSVSVFGEEITEDGAVSVEEMLTQIKGKDSLEIKFSGKIDEVCQKKGCWMDIDAGNDEYISVKFKDYGFFVPKDAAGKEAIIEGVAFLDTISVEELKHYAQDANEPDSVIQKINEPEITYSMMAKGVIIK